LINLKWMDLAACNHYKTMLKLHLSLPVEFHPFTYSCLIKFINHCTDDEMNCCNSIIYYGIFIYFRICVGRTS
jgi:hypothetical protein